ncbi:MMPL family transporter [Pseudomonas capeferrum]|uniref:efflux RND transporter permease subunit n=1 Tax=Pseudomonas capeferrum TaxID=1495066 RepID=UPI0015E40463|nr:MMPL family transporter [Pseudomonas capeferrum]MBA1204822.1 MMPL family transporter [Pseudomonas capeferrum]
MTINIKGTDLAHQNPTLQSFDKRSGNLMERALFNHRLLFILICLAVTVLLAMQASRLVVNAGFDKVIPQNHPYVQNYFENKDKLAGLGNSVRVVVENTQGSIFEPGFLDATFKINQALFLAPGVDRAWMTSIWMAAVRWTSVNEDGFEGGPVMPENYDGSAKSLEQLNTQIRKAGIIGSLVATDLKSIMMVVPMQDHDPETGERLDYSQFAAKLESIRQQYSTAGQGGNVEVHIIGYAKLVGDLIDGLGNIVIYFLISIAIAALFLFLYTRCTRSTLLVVSASLVAVIWQLGIVNSLGFELDPYSVLVPFLIFAIGVSHGAQKMNGIMQDVARGMHPYVAARFTFRRLFLAGLTAILSDAVGFGVLMIIDIPVIKELALTASIGMAALIFTNLLLLPVVLSYTGVSQRAAARALANEKREDRGLGLGRVLDGLTRFTERRWAVAALAVAAVLMVGGYQVRSHLAIGDLDPGAPELWPQARYNQDVNYINNHYRLSSDQFVVMVKTPADACSTTDTLKEIERFTVMLQELPGVLHASALSDNVRNMIAGLNEGSPKWLTISRDASLTGAASFQAMTDNPAAADRICTLVPVIAYLKDHKAQTLKDVVAAAQSYADEHSTPDRQFLLAAGSAGIAAVTNIVVEDANHTMLLYVFAAITLLCFITFRSWRAVLVAIIPLLLAAVLCEALMVLLGIGVKVATLPVIALGVGIGVDYALYLLCVQLTLQRRGVPLAQAYRQALGFTGKVVGLIGVTMAAGVVTWIWSPIKFQADMGILLTFMFVWNMFGALVLIPALSHFLLQTRVPRTSEQLPASTRATEPRMDLSDSSTAKRNHHEREQTAQAPL